MRNLDQWLSEKLEDRRKKELFRTLKSAGDLTDFTSNDYLGLARNEALAANIRETLAQHSDQNGSTGSRLLSGNLPIAISTEKKLAGIFRSDAALLFNSGYSANLAVLSAIPQKDDTIIYDELAHASIKDGARLSLAKKYAFKHNDLADLEKKISNSTGRVFVVVESIYSMDGDECPLEDLVALSKQLLFTLVVDEAHSTGVRGPAGAGICVEKELHSKVDIRIYTFGKAMGVYGACVTGSENLVHYLINFARPFIYTTAPSPHTVASIGCSFDYLSGQMHLQEVLKERIKIFLDNASDLHSTRSLSAIQTVIIPGNRKVREAARALQTQGFDVRPIVSPTVPQGLERLRICLHVFNSQEDITRLAEALTSITGKDRGDLLH